MLFHTSVTYMLPILLPNWYGNRGFAMAKATFSARWVGGLKSSETKQFDYFDNKPPNLGLRLAPSGRKTWFVMYRSGGRLRRLTLGPDHGSFPASGNCSNFPALDVHL